MSSQNFAVIGCMVFESIEYRQTDAVKIMTIFYAVNAKMHPQLIVCIVATLMVHPRIMKIHKSLPGDIPNIFLYQNIILSWRNCIHK